MLVDFAKTLNTHLVDEYKLVMPKKQAIGFMQTIYLPNNLQILIYDYTLMTDFYGKRKASNKEFYIIWFTEAQIPKDNRFLIENNKEETYTSNFSSTTLTSGLFDMNYMTSKGSHFIGLNIILTKEWLDKEFGLSITDSVLRKYLAITSKKLRSEALRDEYKIIWNEILDLM